MTDKKLIPRQEEGAEANVRETVSKDTLESAIAVYYTARKRLLNVFDWDKVCELPSSEFVLLDRNGIRVHRPAIEGDYFRIDIPAPGNAAGDGFDWVKIELIRETESRDEQCTAIRVRPCPNPFTKDPATAHFFDDKATSTFIVYRKGHEVFAEVHGRNEVANIETGKTLNNIRNALIAWGAKLGFSFPQWKSLAAGLLKE